MEKRPNDDIAEVVSKAFEANRGARLPGWNTLLWLFIGLIGLIFTILMLFVLFVALRTSLLYGLAELSR
ncbi:MAG: hypothetical protein ACUVSX_16495 [Aggregatilineales bacterium]